MMFPAFWLVLWAVVEGHSGSNSDIGSHSHSNSDTDSHIHSDSGGRCELGRYSREDNRWQEYLTAAREAREAHRPCAREGPGCSTCYREVVARDLAPWQEGGVSREQVMEAARLGRATRYQVVSHRLYRSADCMFPSRCRGLEHFLLQLLPELEDTEFVVNVRDWPQVSIYHNSALPVFSFSKVPGEHRDILYPAWAFWGGGPATALHPKGLGRWDQLRESLASAALATPWDSKDALVYFRGSRTSAERDALVLLARRCPKLVDAQYTKNQGWKSDADTLGAPPAQEAKLEDHCGFRYLVNYRGVAASFRLKHLFLCGSLVLHVGQEWQEFFYPALKPWVHYVPVPSQAGEEEILGLIHFLEEHQGLARSIAEAGADFITSHLALEDVSCYWRNLLESYTGLLNYTITRDQELVEVLV